MLRYHARWVLPVSRPPIDHGTVVEHGGRIVYVGDRTGAPEGDDVDLGESALVPGLVNAHTHLELTVMRGFLEDLPFREWIVRLQGAKRAVLDDSAMLDSALLGIAEGLLAGVTTFADTCDSGVALRAMREMGVRGVMYQEVFGPAPDQCDEALALLREKVRAARALETPLHRVGVSPHAPYTVSDALFTAVAAYARDEGLPTAVHIAESEAEYRYVRDAQGPFAEALRGRGIAVTPRGRTPIAMLDRLGVLAARPLLIHCVRADTDDLELVAAAGCAIVHCPASNAKLGHGIAPLLEMLDAGIAVGLGSDSVASNNRMDVLEEAHIAVLVQRAWTGRAEALSSAQALELATLGGARALGLDNRVGSLEPGKDADLAAFHLGSARGLPVQDPAAALVHAVSGAAATFVAVAGRVLVRDGRLLTADVADLLVRARRGAGALAAWRDAMKSGPPAPATA